MAIYDFFLSRNNAATITAENYVGHVGRLFYDDTTGVIKLSDGVTPGGLDIPYTIASSTVIGGIKAGPGVVIDSEGTLFIDSEGLEFSFGDFTATVGTYTDSTEYALLSSVKADEDVVIASNSTGSVKVVGAFEIHATNGTVTGSLETEPFFKIKDDGQVRILVPLADTTEGGMEIIGSDLGTSLSVGIAGTMLHLTGNADLPTRVYHDTLGDYSSYVFRRYNGSVITPTQVLSGEHIARINFTAATDAGMGNVSLAQIRISTLEDQTTTAQGSEMRFFVTPVGDTASNRISVLDLRAAGVNSDVGFIGDLTGTASTATNLTAATSILAGTLNVDPPAIGKNGSATATYTLTGLTTNHKVIVMPQAALPDEFNITASWASAANTLSIQYQTYGGGVDAAAFDIAYWAWV